MVNDTTRLPRIVLAPCLPDVMERARVRENAAGAHCFYLGTNFVKARETLDWAGKNAFVTPEPARLFREACVRTKPAYIEWMGRLSERVHSPDWWSIPLSTKSPYLSQVFVSLAYLDMIRTYLTRQTAANLFLVVESSALAAVLESYFVSAGNPVRRYRRNSSWSLKWAWSDLVRHTVPRLRFLKDEWLKRRRLGRGRRLPPAGERLTLIRTWFFSGAYQDGRFRDIYFGDLSALIRSKGRRVLTVLSLYDPSDADRLRELLDSHQECIAMEQVVGYWEVIKIFCRTFFIPSIDPGPLKFNGADVAPLVEYELRRLRFDPTRAFALIHAAFVRNLWRRKMIVEAAYYPYENQGWEKLFCLELRRRYPDIWIGGYQHAALFDMLLTYYSSPPEIRVAPGPNTLLVSGSHPLDHFRRQGYSGVRVVYPIRYSSLDETVKSLAAYKSGGPARYDFLVCTPSAYPETLEMFTRLVCLFAGRSAKVAVKVHNMLDWDAVLDRLGSIGVTVPPDWERVTGKLTDAILDSRALLWMSSSAYLDALALGKPAVHIVPSHTVDIEWIDLPQGCLHLYPEDTYEMLVKNLQGMQSGNSSAEIEEFVRNRLAFNAPVAAFLPDADQSFASRDSACARTSSTETVFKQE